MSDDYYPNNGPPSPRHLAILQGIEYDILSRFSKMKQVEFIDLKDDKVRAIAPIFDQNGDPIEHKAEIEVNERFKGRGRTIVIQVNGGADPESVQGALDKFYKAVPYLKTSFHDKRKIEVEMPKSGVTINLESVVDEILKEEAESEGC